LCNIKPFHSFGESLIEKVAGKYFEIGGGIFNKKCHVQAVQLEIQTSFFLVAESGDTDMVGWVFTKTAIHRSGSSPNRQFPEHPL
jgi:hypothetical protein